MDSQWTQDATIQHLVEWGSAQNGVRAMLLTSTRAVPGAVVDALSDYDVVLVLDDIMPFHASRGWLDAFGAVMALYHDPLRDELGFQCSAYITQYVGGLKIDFSLWPVGYLEAIAARAQPLPELDAGYRVLLDKDGLAAALPPPTYRAYIPTPPTQSAYLETIENFFETSIYVGKYLWRGDCIAARFVQDTYLKEEALRPVLEWHYEIERGWSVKPGLFFRGMGRWLRADLWEDLKQTYTGVEEEESWAALFRVIALMRKAASEVGERLGFAYPLRMEALAIAELERIRGLPRRGQS